MPSRLLSWFTPRVAAVGRWLARPGPRFWFFLLGLLCIARGAALISEALAWLAAGVIILRDCSRPAAPPAPPRLSR